MTVSSMTGFARAAGVVPVCAWAWEAKSVNGKGLDVRVRVPRGFDALEIAARDRVAKRFKRGNISLNLDLTWSHAQVALKVNEDVLSQVVQAVGDLQKTMPTVQAPCADGILALRGVLEQVDVQHSDEDHAFVEQSVLQGLDQMLDQLQEGRNGEGERLNVVLRAQMTSIDDLCQSATALAALQPKMIRKRLAKQVEALCQDIEMLNPERLAQEAAVLMIKADIREELDRLNTHVTSARDLMAKEEPVGRRLDFLCQEFNREANTLCSKSTDTELTKIGLELKSVIEQFREQVQNIE